MSKIFTWLFGFVIGVIGGLGVVSVAMVERPGDFMRILLLLSKRDEED